jgi:hypothetical protein
VFKWLNIILGNVKNALRGTKQAISDRHLGPVRKLPGQNYPQIWVRFGCGDQRKTRRRNSASLRILRLSRDQRWPEDELQDVHVIYRQALTPLFG